MQNLFLKYFSIMAMFFLSANINGVWADSVETRIGKLSFEYGLPTIETTDKLFDELDFQRAVQAYIWGLPIVSMARQRLHRKKIPAL